MDRKTWLKTFVGLAVSNAAAIDYRKKLRLKLPAVAHHIKKLAEYREELEAIEKKEVDDERLRKRQEAAAKARAKLARRREAKRISSTINAGTPSATVDPETLESQEDSRERE